MEEDALQLSYTHSITEDNDKTQPKTEWWSVFRWAIPLSSLLSARTSFPTPENRRLRTCREAENPIRNATAEPNGHMDIQFVN